MSFIKDIPFPDYCKMEGKNASALKKIPKSMKHLKHYLDNGMADSKALRRGRLIHSWLLDHDTRLAGIATYKGITSGKGSKLAKKAFDNENVGKTIVTIEELKELDAMYESVMSESAFATRIEKADTEVVGVWENKAGVGKCRYDMVDQNDFCDVKSIGDISIPNLTRQFYKLGYDIQFGWYADCFFHEFGRMPTAFVIWVESVPPFDVCIDQVCPNILEKGRERALELAMKWKVAEVTGIWEGVNPYGVRLLDEPAWMGGAEKEKDVSTGEMKAEEL